MNHQAPPYSDNTGDHFHRNHAAHDAMFATHRSDFHQRASQIGYNNNNNVNYANCRQMTIPSDNVFQSKNNKATYDYQQRMSQSSQFQNHQNMTQPSQSTTYYQQHEQGASSSSYQSTGQQSNKGYTNGPSSSGYNVIPVGRGNATGTSQAVPLSKAISMQRSNGRTLNQRRMMREMVLRHGYPISASYRELKGTHTSLFMRHYLGRESSVQKSEFDCYLPKKSPKEFFPSVDLFINLCVNKDGFGDDLAELCFDRKAIIGIDNVMKILLSGLPLPIRQPKTPTVIVPLKMNQPPKRKLSQFQAKVEEIPLDQCHGLNTRQHLHLVQQQNQRPAHLLNRDHDGPLFVPRQRFQPIQRVTSPRVANDLRNTASFNQSLVQKTQKFFPPKSPMEAINSNITFNATGPGQFKSVNPFAETAPSSSAQFTQSMTSTQETRTAYWHPISSSVAAPTTTTSIPNSMSTSVPIVSPVRGQTRSYRPIPPNMIVFDQNRPTYYRHSTNRLQPSAPSNMSPTKDRLNMGGNAGRNVSPAKAAPAPGPLRRKERTIVSTAKAIVSYFPIDENPTPTKRRRTSGSPFSELNPSTIGTVP